ncbi:hypothetical protein ASPVEDRAFT_592559 [Aspergillus versicolor CBS 583.65]|uniref:Uncharacterized protein n=1 Tax=Aspergillus versicolor CBS 583.65 TaxID=1036611 RepID=A0A1L9PHF8_ASPVE|nr:uncharacterized protein ASPVEDRAFT_592559 [Aspergillus versicolor CBS 583.65]OJJ00885.1 hypothetical protein ASPVEDRAFT_592559 [Aspergillus versicolor CBS 583.65]
MSNPRRHDVCLITMVDRSNRLGDLWTDKAGFFVLGRSVRSRMVSLVSPLPILHRGFFCPNTHCHYRMPEIRYLLRGNAWLCLLWVRACDGEAKKANKNGLRCLLPPNPGVLEHYCQPLIRFGNDCFLLVSITLLKHQIFTLCLIISKSFCLGHASD